MPSERTKGPNEVFCRHCGDAINVRAEVCPQCGVRNEQYNRQMSQKNKQTDGFGRSTDVATGGTGLDANVTAALSYVLGFVSGIAVYLLEDDRFARFHAAQSIVLSGMLVVVEFVLGVVFFVFALIGLGVGPVAALLGGLVSLVTLCLWVFMILTAYQGKTHRIPIAADIADTFAPDPDGASRTNEYETAGTETDALAELRKRYARGEIDETEFERRLERLLESEHTDGKRREPADTERSR
jgi:uncharacterized membrane protein/ribosomal protein L37E